MPKIIERHPVTVYAIDELTPDAREKAIRDHRYCNVDYEWWEFICSEYDARLRALGFADIDIKFSGFSSQGDGASFTFRAHFVDLLDTWRKMQHENISNGATLDPIKPLPFDMEQYAVLHEAYINTHIYTRRNTHHYVHHNTVDIDYSFTPDADDANEAAPKADGTQWTDDELHALMERFIDDLEAWRVDECDDIYKELDAEFDYLTSDDIVTETLLANEVWFLENGTPYHD